MSFIQQKLEIDGMEKRYLDQKHQFKKNVFLVVYSHQL